VSISYGENLGSTIVKKKIENKRNVKKIRRKGEGTYSYKNLTCREVAEEVFIQSKRRRVLQASKPLRPSLPGKQKSVFI